MRDQNVIDALLLICVNLEDAKDNIEAGDGAYATVCVDEALQQAKSLLPPHLRWK
jgi:hypothetical protein